MLSAHDFPRDMDETYYENTRSDGPTEMWVQKNGQHIRLLDMTDKHIKACIAMLHRSKVSYGRDMFVFIKELNDRERIRNILEERGL